MNKWKRKREIYIANAYFMHLLSYCIFVSNGDQISFWLMSLTVKICYGHVKRGPWDASCRKFVPCVQNPSSSCITECCDSFNFWAPLPQKCSCWRTARNTNREALYALQNYCGFQPPTLCPHLQVSDFLPFCLLHSSHYSLLYVKIPLSLYIDSVNDTYSMRSLNCKVFTDRFS